MNEIQPLGLLNYNSTLKKLIKENPDLPITFLVSEDTHKGDYNWQYCSEISYRIDEILDCQVPFAEDEVFSDRTYFEERLSDYLSDLPENNDLDDDEFEALCSKELKSMSHIGRKQLWLVFTDKTSIL